VPTTAPGAPRVNLAGAALAPTPSGANQFGLASAESLLNNNCEPDDPNCPCLDTEDVARDQCERP
jgi:hypothetical protein